MMVMAFSDYLGRACRPRYSEKAILLSWDSREEWDNMGQTPIAKTKEDSKHNFKVTGALKLHVLDTL